jgi:hypothetical protein
MKPILQLEPNGKVKKNRYNESLGREVTRIYKKGVAVCATP